MAVVPNFNPGPSGLLIVVGIAVLFVVALILVTINSWRGSWGAHRRWRQEQAAKEGKPTSAFPRFKGGKHLRKPP
jgi:hypothetical protein